MKEYAALIKVLLVIGAASALFLGGCHYGTTKAENVSMKAEQKALSELAEKLEEERQRANGLNEQIRALLDRPAAKDTIRTVIRENPSNCARPPALVDGLRQEIDSANQAIAASRGGNPVSGNPTNRKH